MPTSAGKTRIAELAIVHTLVSTPGSKCAYIAPFRALAAELEDAFFGVISDLGYRVAAALGSYETDEYEFSSLQQTDLLVTTPEKMDLILRSQPQLLENLRLLVLDEAQLVDESNRGPKFELLITRLKRRLPNMRVIVVSAVFPQETLEDFAKWFSSSTTADVLTDSWRPSVQRVARFEWNGFTGVIRYEPQAGNEFLHQFVPGVINSRQLEFVNPETARTNRKWFPDRTSKAQTAAELVFRLADLGPVLVFCPQANHVSAVAGALAERLRLARLIGEPVPGSFTGRAELSMGASQRVDR